MGNKEKIIKELKESRRGARVIIEGYGRIVRKEMESKSKESFDYRVLDLALSAGDLWLMADEESLKDLENGLRDNKKNTEG